MKAGNPYNPTQPVVSTEKFIGRNDLIKRLSIETSRSGCINIVGKHRSGKTSILYNLRELVQASENWQNQKEGIFVYLNFQEPKINTQIGFFVEILSRINDKASRKLQKQGNSQRLWWEIVDVIQETLEEQKMHLVLLLDECEVALHNSQEFPLKFWHLLRAINQSSYGMISYVIATQKALSEYNYELDHLQDHASPFFNIFYTRQLPDFTDEEIEELFDLSDKKFSLEEKRWVRNYAGGNILKLQVACYTLYELKRNPLSLVTKYKFEQEIKNAEYYFQINDYSKKQVSHPTKKAAFWTMLFLAIILIPVIGYAAIYLGDLFDNIANVVVGGIIMLIIILVLFGRFSLAELKSYIEHILGIK